MQNKLVIYTIVFTILLLLTNKSYSIDDQYARSIVILKLEQPNKLNVSGKEFKNKENPKGVGTFVYDPRTSFYGIKRNLIWIVVDDNAYPLNGASKNLTPKLPWPREADENVWSKTNLDKYSAQEAINIVFNK